MSADQQAPERQLSLAVFNEMFADFLNGAISLAQLRQSLVDVIDGDPDALPEVRQLVDAAMYDGRLPEQTWENLVAEIDHLVSEDTPTEWSEDTKTTPESDEAIVKPPVLVETVDTQEPASAAKARSSAPQAPAESLAQTETTQPMPDTTELPPGTVLEDRYVLVSRSENGSMGTVYKALDRQQKEAGAVDPWVAIKLITAEFGKHTAAIDTLRNEAEIGCRLNHPNIARSHALHEGGEHLFISMEWLHGESLSELLDRKRPNTLPRDQALNIIEGLASGLAYAHRQGIVHADIKPANVFMTQTGEVKLLDFGIARANDGMPLTGGLVAKTPAYASCEVLEGDNPNFQDDLFSLASVAYRVLTGQRPFGSANALEAESEQREPVPVPGLSPQQWRALSTALAWRREQRSADVQSFLTEFFGEEEIVLASPEPVTATPPAAAAEPARCEPPAGSATPDVPAAESEMKAAPAPQPAASEAGDAAEPMAEVFEDDEKSRAAWLRPALAAGVVGVAVVGGWMMFGGDQAQVPATVSDARLEVAEETAAESPAPVTKTAESLVEEAAAVATVAATSPEPARALPEPAPEPQGPQIAAAAKEQAQAPVAEPEPAAEPADEAPDNGAGGAAVAAAALTATSVTEAAAETAKVADTSADEPAAAETVAEESPKADAPAEQTAAADTAPPASEPEAVEADTVSAPAEAMLASTMSLAMVSPDSTQRAAGVKQDNAPLPEPVAAPEPDAYGPPPELAPPKIEEVLMSTLKFKRFVEPKFPRRARDEGVQGWVDVRFLVTAEGRTAEIEVLDSQPGGTFDEAAVAAVERWRFKQRRIDGEAVPSRTGIRLRFDQ
jgi:TonB family protein